MVDTVTLVSSLKTSHSRMQKVKEASLLTMETLIPDRGNPARLSYTKDYKCIIIIFGYSWSVGSSRQTVSTAHFRQCCADSIFLSKQWYGC